VYLGAEGAHIRRIAVKAFDTERLARGIGQQPTTIGCLHVLVAIVAISANGVVFAFEVSYW